MDRVHLANRQVSVMPLGGARDNEPPGYWRVADGLPVPQFSHHDATPLCRTATGAVAEPVEAEHNGDM